LKKGDANDMFQQVESREGNELELARSEPANKKRIGEEWNQGVAPVGAPNQGTRTSVLGPRVFFYPGD